METLRQQLKGVRIRVPKRIYTRPHVVKKTRDFIIYKRDPKTARCKVCYRSRPRDQLITVEGGSDQGHREYYICPEHQ